MWLAVWILILFIIALMWVFQVQLLEESYLSMKKNRLEQIEVQITKLLGSTGYLESLHSGFNEISASEGVHIAIMNASGDLFYSSIARDLPFFRTSSITFLTPSISWMEDGQPFQVALGAGQQFPRGAFLVRGLPISDSPRGWVYAILSEPLSQMQETTNVIERQIFWISFLSIIFGSLLALFFARFFSKQIIRVKDAARKISRGDFDVYVPPGASDELGELTESINEMALQLRKIETFREELITNTSHDLRTPINTILAYAEILQDFHEEPDSDLKDHVRIIIHEAKVLSQRVDKILELSRMESGGYSLNHEPVGLRSLIYDVIQPFTPVTGEQEIQFSVDVNPEWTIEVDRHWMYRALSNLVENAVKYSNFPSTITICGEPIEGHLRLRIIDQGIGIPPEAIPHVWDRFYKVDRSRKEAEDSPGLGMSIARAILEAHGCTYGIQSQFGKGTTVWISFSTGRIQESFIRRKEE